MVTGPTSIRSSGSLTHLRFAENCLGLLTSKGQVWIEDFEVSQDREG